MKKIDLVMWTLNSEKTLGATLESIERGIHSKYVNQKIIIDGYSKDTTREIGIAFGWKVLKTVCRGIGNQANIALGLVETEVFASFEHDIILHPSWFELIRPQIEGKKVAVVQGVRLATNPVLYAIEKESLRRETKNMSIDNNMYKTNIIRNLGGYSPDYPASTDQELRHRVLEAGFKWIIDRRVISRHIKPSIKETARHLHKLSMLKDYPEDSMTADNLKKLIFSPIRGLQIALNQNCPMAVLAYPYCRFWRMKTVMKLRGVK